MFLMHSWRFLCNCTADMEKMSKSMKKNSNNLPQQCDVFDCYCVSEGEVTSRAEFHAGDWRDGRGVGWHKAQSHQHMNGSWVHGSADLTCGGGCVALLQHLEGQAGCERSWEQARSAPSEKCLEWMIAAYCNNISHPETRSKVSDDERTWPRGASRHLVDDLWSQVQTLVWPFGGSWKKLSPVFVCGI